MTPKERQISTGCTSGWSGTHIPQPVLATVPLRPLSCPRHTTAPRTYKLYPGYQKNSDFTPGRALVLGESPPPKHVAISPRGSPFQMYFQMYCPVRFYFYRTNGLMHFGTNRSHNDRTLYVVDRLFNGVVRWYLFRASRS